MRKALLTVLALALLPAGLSAVDGVVLINQSTVMAAGGFPYNITQPGSYRLTGNLVPGLNQMAIRITASNVALDLNGFTIQCSADPNLTDGISCIGDGGSQAPTHNTAIRNGTLTFSVSGATRPLLASVFGLGFSSSDRIIVENLGIDVTEDNGAIVSFPYSVGFFSIIRNNVVWGNRGSPLVNCPSIIVENANQHNALPNGTGCVFVNNAAF